MESLSAAFRSGDLVDPVEEHLDSRVNPGFVLPRASLAPVGWLALRVESALRNELNYEETLNLYRVSNHVVDYPLLTNL